MSYGVDVSMLDHTKMNISLVVDGFFDAEVNDDKVEEEEDQGESGDEDDNEEVGEGEEEEDVG